jgi:hypothetical protein
VYYDDACVRELIKRRADLGENPLLLHLVLPDDFDANGILDSITADLETLGAHAVPLFRNKMRNPERAQLESWRTELWFGAWITKLPT